MLINPLSDSDCQEMAEIHRQCFSDSWNKESIQSMMQLPTTRVWGVYQSFVEVDKILSAFVMISQVDREVEILTFCVLPSYRRQGIASQLLLDLIQYLSSFGKILCYLEVEENNFSAIELYKKFGFKIYGKRPDYYRQPNGIQTAALLMKKEIIPLQRP